ncbi:hypothetical protein BC936DRAFT_139373 [Jimgerdemannia flammicorona]|uniref:Uncharacterized protein n=1 Tax=Jimgerdemannia flammicorona TaxID=994334 RepID=A0A433BA00_9FUNG|nr:hypothetical protein BC936DRAFT_139373 [Jimgerdemannia flammicorona]
MSGRNERVIVDPIYRQSPLLSVGKHSLNPFPHPNMSAATVVKRSFWQTWYRAERNIIFLTLLNTPLTLTNVFPRQIIPIYITVGSAVGLAGWYLSRLARGPEVVWNRSVGRSFFPSLTLLPRWLKLDARIPTRKFHNNN